MIKMNKTIDFTLRTFTKDYKIRVPGTFTVLELKGHIARQLNISVTQQRFIYLGHELYDEEKLDDLDINGKVMHLVQRLESSGTIPYTVLNGRRGVRMQNNQYVPFVLIDNSNTFLSGGIYNNPRMNHHNNIVTSSNDVQATSQSSSLTDSLARQIRVGNESVSPSNLDLGLESTSDSDRQSTAPSPEELLITPIGNIPYFRDLEGQFILVDFFLLLARNWTFHDMLNLDINNGQSSIVQNPVSRNTANVVSFILQRIMLNQTPTKNHIEEAANRIFLEMIPYLNVLQIPMSTSEKKNIHASFLHCIIKNLQEIVLFINERIIFTSDNIVAKLTTFAKEFLALISFWSKGLAEFESTIHEILELLSLPTTLLDTVVVEFLMKAHQYWESIATFQSLNLSMVHHFISSNELVVGQSSSVDDEDQIYNSTLPSSEVTNEPLPEVLIGSQESMMHHGIAAESVPARDSQRQRLQETQPINSDAYLSGMPDTPENNDEP